MPESKVIELVSSYEELITTFVELSQFKGNYTKSKQYKAKIQYLNERKTELLDEIEILRNRLNLQEIYQEKKQMDFNDHKITKAQKEDYLRQQIDSEYKKERKMLNLMMEILTYMKKDSRNFIQTFSFHFTNVKDQKKENGMK